MPYIVTTSATCEECHGQGEKRPSRAHMSHEVTDCPECGTSGVNVSRRAVATLGEAKQIAYDAVGTAASFSSPSWRTLRADVYAMPDIGGTIGPLPDGTLIGVERS